MQQILGFINHAPKLLISHPFVRAGSVGLVPEEVLVALALDDAVGGREGGREGGRGVRVVCVAGWAVGGRRVCTYFRCISTRLVNVGAMVVVEDWEEEDDARAMDRSGVMRNEAGACRVKACGPVQWPRAARVDRGLTRCIVLKLGVEGLVLEKWGGLWVRNQQKNAAVAFAWEREGGNSCQWRVGPANQEAAASRQAGIL